MLIADATTGKMTENREVIPKTPTTGNEEMTPPTEDPLSKAGSSSKRKIADTPVPQETPPPVEVIDLNKIKLDEDIQVRVVMNNSHIRDLRLVLENSDDGKFATPIVVFFDGATYWLADGYHRYHAYQEAKRSTVEAEVRQGSKRDAVWYATSANTTHGLHMTSEDKRKAITTILKDDEWCKLSDREIGRRCGADGKTVAAIREKLTAEIPHSSTRTVTTKHGTIATMKTDNIGKSKSKKTEPAPTPAATDSNPIQAVSSPRLLSDDAAESRAEAVANKLPDDRDLEPVAPLPIVDASVLTSSVDEVVEDAPTTPHEDVETVAAPLIKCRTIVKGKSFGVDFYEAKEITEEVLQKALEIGLLQLGYEQFRRNQEIEI